MLLRYAMAVIIWCVLFIIGNSQLCPYSQYFDGTNCVQCDQSCSSCSGPGSSLCTGCSAPLMFWNSTCVNACPSGYLLNSRQNKCQICFRNCQTCANGYNSFQGFCIRTCPIGTISDGSGNCQQSSRISAPIIVIADTNLGYINLDADLFLDVEVISKSAFSATWTTNETTLFQGIAINQPKILIPKSHLETSKTYQLNLTATNQVGSAVQVVTFRTFSDPVIGEISVSPNQISAIETQYMINISGFSGDQGFLVDVIAVQIDLTAQEYSNLRSVITNLTETKTTKTILNPVLLAKELQNDPNGFSASLTFPPIEVSARYKILIMFYNLYQRFVDETTTVLVNAQETNSISSYSQLASSIDVYYASKLIRIYLNFTTVGQCYQSANLLQYSHSYGNEDCPPQHCNNNGLCSFSGSRPSCSCNSNSTGFCCQTLSNNSAYSSLALLSTMATKISQFPINSQNYGPIAQTIAELSCLVDYMSSNTIGTLITAFTNVLSQDYYFTLYLAGELYAAWARIRALSQNILSQNQWNSQISNFESIKGALESSIARSLDQDTSFSTQTYFLSSYSAAISGSDLLLMNSVPQAMKNQNGADSSTGTSLVSNPISNFRIDVCNTSFFIPKTISLAPNEIIRISVLQGNFFFEPNSTSTFSVSLNLTRDNQSILLEDAQSQIEVIIPKMVQLPYPNYENLYSCVLLDNESTNITDCTLLDENASHILCSCSASANLSLISGKALYNTQSESISLACCLWGTQESTAIQYSSLFIFLDEYATDICIDTHGILDKWTALGLVVLLVFATLYLFGCLIICFIDIYENKRIQELKKEKGLKETQACRYNRNFTLSPLYSIIFCAKVQGTSRKFRWILSNYFWLNLLGWGFAYNDGLSYTNAIPVFIKSLFGLFTAWIWYYVSIGLINYLQKPKALRSKKKHTINTQLLTGVIVMNLVGWGLYFILRTSVLDLQSIYRQIASSVALAFIDATLVDLIIILIGRRFSRLQFYLSLRGFYKDSDEENEEPSPDIEGTERGALKSSQEAEIGISRPLPSKIFFAASEKETFEGPLGPLRGTIIAKAD